MTKFKRFIVLMDERYYPSAGMGSAQGSFDTLPEAMAFAMTKGHEDESYFHADYVQIFDCDERRVVWKAE